MRTSPRFRAAAAAPALAGAALGAVTALLLGPPAARAVSLDQACGIFASKLSAAQASGNSQQAQTIYQEGSERIAARFNGASCPNVKPPSP